MKEPIDVLYQKALDAIQELYAFDEVTADKLDELKEEIEMLIDSLS